MRSEGDGWPFEANASRNPSVTSDIRDFWDADAATYDDSPYIYPKRPQEQAAWAATLRRLLPAPPARVLDMGAGTGFLSLLLAVQGYEVTAADFSPRMLSRLRAKAADRELAIKVVETDAMNPPSGTFDAVVARHLIWTLVDPVSALVAWHGAAPNGRLVLLEGAWTGRGASTGERLRMRGRTLADLIRKPPPCHHDWYSPQMNSELPYPRGLTPDEAVALVEAGLWGQARIERLRDVEWAVTEGLNPLASLFGTHSRWAIVAGQ